MKALLSREVGGPETLTIGELPDPVAKPGEVVTIRSKIRSKTALSAASPEPAAIMPVESAW